jgi:hypothetical protein
VRVLELELVPGQVLERVLVPHNRQVRPRLIPVPTELTILYFSPIFLLLLKNQFVSLILNFIESYHPL